MRSEKGITLISLTVYIIVMLIVVAVVSMISMFFYKNTNALSNTINPLTEYTKFNHYFSDEVNHANLKVLEWGEDYLVFDNNIQYTYVAENKGIYRNNVKICKDVEKCIFESKIKNGKNVVAVTIKIGTAEERNVDYTLKD